jgi:hypothetical protein
MRRVPAVASLVVLSFIPFSLFAQQSPPPLAPVRDPQAITVLRNALAAMGGTTAASQLQDSVTQAAISWPTNPSAPAATTSITTKGMNRIRVDTNANAKSTSVIYDRGRQLRSGQKGWQVAPSANSRFRRADHLPALLLAYELSRNDFSASYVGIEPVGTATAHHITLSRISSMGNSLDGKFTKDSQIEIFVDPTTFLVVKVSFVHFSEIDWRIGLPMEIDYSSYQNVGGMMVPFTQVTIVNGKPIYELHLTSVAFNQGVADATFAGK